MSEPVSRKNGKYLGFHFALFFRFLRDVLRDCVGQKLCWVDFRVDPVADCLFGEDQGHAVVDMGYVFAGLFCKDYEDRQAVFNPVQAAEIGDIRALRLDGVFRFDGASAVFRRKVLPLKIPGGGDDAAVLLPGIPEGGFLGSRL